ncbi:MAG: hypothetical protein ACL93V_06420 [Candidatus Electrothrix sp. YB6]
MKKIAAALMVTAFALSIGIAFAATEKCKIENVEVKDDQATVTMTCEKDAKLKTGDKVKVRVDKKKVVEGC